MMNEYKYLFPFEKIPMGSKVLLYGAGEVGHAYLKQILMTNYCECLGFIDRAYDKCPKTIVPIYAPNFVSQLAFDYIILSMKTDLHIREILSVLLSLGVANEKIIYTGVRKNIDTLKSIVYTSLNEKHDNGRFSIALRYGHNLGDCIVKKRLFTEFVRLIPDCIMDIYSPYASHFINAIYKGHPNLGSIIDDGGEIYRTNMRKYCVSIDVSHLLSVDYFDEVKTESISKNIVNIFKNLIKKTNDYGLLNEGSHRSSTVYARMRYKNLNYYTSYNEYCDAFSIQDMKVEIPLLEEYKEKFEELNLRKYITINYGNGVVSSANGETIAKQWPFDYFQKFINLFRASYSNIDIIQLGAKGARQFSGVKMAILGENLELVKYILKNSIIHVDIEGGVVHLATQLGTKCAVLFGPTPVEFFGYPQNINIVSQKCNGCYALYDDISKCAKDLKESECMRSITPEKVMNRIEDHIKNFC